MAERLWQHNAQPYDFFLLFCVVAELLWLLLLA